MMLPLLLLLLLMTIIVDEVLEILRGFFFQFPFSALACRSDVETEVGRYHR